MVRRKGLQVVSHLVFCPTLYLWDKFWEMAPPPLPIGLICEARGTEPLPRDYCVSSFDFIATEGGDSAVAPQHLAGRIELTLSNSVPLDRARHLAARKEEGVADSPGLNCNTPIVRLIRRGWEFPFDADRMRCLSAALKANWHEFGLHGLLSEDWRSASSPVKYSCAVDGFPYAMWEGVLWN